MRPYELYTTLPDGRKKLLCLFDAATDAVTMVHNAQPVTMQASQPLRTSVQPTPKATPTPQPALCPHCDSVMCHCAGRPPLAARAPQPKRITTMAEAKRAILEELTRGVPPAPTLDQVVARQRELGLR